MTEFSAKEEIIRLRNEITRLKKIYDTCTYSEMIGVKGLIGDYEKLIAKIEDDIVISEPLAIPA